jgi:hypothetical protein
MAAARPLANVSQHSESLSCQDGLGRARSAYIRRRPEDTVLHQVVREHLETFLTEARLRGSGEGLPGASKKMENRKPETVLIFTSKGPLAADFFTSMPPSEG